jgi:2'-5' RNA ligase
MSPGAARLFAAVDLPAGVRGPLAAWAERAAGADAALRAIGEEALHVTLCFLGGRPVDEVERIGGLVVAHAAPVGELALGEALWLPRRRPHVLGVELLDPTGALTSLQAGIAATLSAEAGYEPDHRRFLPHVTVARVRHGARPQQRELAPLPAVPEGFAGEALTLYRSHLGAGPARYEVVASLPLGGAQPSGR